MNEQHHDAPTRDPSAGPTDQQAADDLPQLPPEADELLRAGKKIEAIKVIRESLKVDLRDAKSAAEQRAVQLGLQSKPSSCFVATAAFGGPFEAEVVALRRFRDERLAHAAAGRAFIRRYNAVGPALARTIQDRPRARRACRGLLRPVARVVARFVR